MKKLSEFKNEKAIEIIADLFIPIAELIGNEENLKAQKLPPILMFSAFMKNSPKEMMKIFAILEEVEVENYNCNAIEVAKNLVTLVSDKELLSLFISQEQKED